MNGGGSLHAVMGLWRFLLNQALNKVREKMIPIAVKQVKAAEIPNIESNLYAVRDIKINEFNIAKSEVIVDEGSIVSVVLEDIDVGVSLSWAYDAVFISGNGTAEAFSDKVRAKVIARVGFDFKTYTPTVTVTVTDTDFDIGNLDVRLEGGATAAVANLIIPFIRRTACQYINDTVGPMLGPIVEDVLRDQLVSRQALFRNIFYGIVAVLILILTLIIYFNFFYNSSSPEPEPVPIEEPQIDPPLETIPTDDGPDTLAFQ